MDNYEKLIERISSSSGLAKEEIGRKVEAKRAKLSGLVSREGAAQIVAAELGINFDQERMKLSEVVQGMKRVNTVGKVVTMNPVRGFNKNGREGKVASFLIADESSNSRVVLWDTNHIALVEQEKLKPGTVVEISNASSRNGELHLSSFSDIRLSKEVMDKVMVEKNYGEKKLKDSKPGETIKTRAFVVQAYDPKFFEVCPQCGKKVVDEECRVHGKVSPTRKALISLVLDDGSETMRSVIFGEMMSSIGLNPEEVLSAEDPTVFKNRILGEERIFSGKVVMNAMFNNIELSVDHIEKVVPEELVQQLEGSSKS